MLSDAVAASIAEALGAVIQHAHLATKGEYTMTYDLSLSDGRELVLRLPCFHSTAPVVEVEVATSTYLSRNTSIPVPSVVASQNATNETSSVCFAIYEKPSGRSLDTIFTELSSQEQGMIVTSLARWMVEGFHLTFPRIGGLTGDSEATIGPIVSKPFYADGRAKLPLERGPFTSARAYYLACAQRELDACRMLFTQDAPASYQRDLEESRVMVERIAGLLCDLTCRCRGLDDDDPEMAPFSLDIHGLALKDIFVSPENSTHIVAVTGWQFVSTRPLWCCARLPTWLSPSMSSHQDTARLAAIFKAEVARIEGVDSPFLRALDLDDTRYTLDDLSSYDAFRDGFLLLPALENILATLPGHEDFAGLNALLDPSTLPGRVARINLLTRGSNAMYLAMTPPRSPQTLPVKDEGTEKAMPPDSSVLVT
ncbi:hypothetical protein GY45DRAFT_1300264 [Cubamyces sp. BRFM 1775]|nr:hypothetical protein GY45DRAFT_1300264 [Cubamyces sp. BRFM 1775]